MVDIVTALAFLFIHLTLPVTGIILYFMLLKRMRRERVEQRPVWSLFILFGTYGAILTIVLTALFWQWSGILSFLMIYLIFLAPIVLGIIAYRNYCRRMLSVYHKYTFIAAIACYPAVFSLLIGGFILYLLYSLAK